MYTVFLTDFARRATYCVHVSTALCVSNLLRTCEYVFASKAAHVLKATYAYKLRLLRVKRLIIEGLYCSFRRGDDSPADIKCFFMLQ